MDADRRQTLRCQLEKLPPDTRSVLLISVGAQDVLDLLAALDKLQDERDRQEAYLRELTALPCAPFAPVLKDVTEEKRLHAALEEVTQERDRHVTFCQEQAAVIVELRAAIRGLLATDHEGARRMARAALDDAAPEVPAQDA